MTLCLLKSADGPIPVSTTCRAWLLTSVRFHNNGHAKVTVSKGRCKVCQKNTHFACEKVKGRQHFGDWDTLCSEACHKPQPWRLSECVTVPECSIYRFPFNISNILRTNILRTLDLIAPCLCHKSRGTTVRSDVEERFAEERLAWNDKNVPAWPKNISLLWNFGPLHSALYEIRTW